MFKRKHAFFFIFILTSTLLFAQQKGWWENILPHRNSHNVPSTPLIEPHPDVVNLQDSFAKVAGAVKPAVVNISAVQITRVQTDHDQFFYGDPNEFFFRFFGEGGVPQQPRSQPREYRREGTGSGVIIDSDGTILT